MKTEIQNSLERGSAIVFKTPELSLRGARAASKGGLDFARAQGEPGNVGHPVMSRTCRSRNQTVEVNGDRLFRPGYADPMEEA
jgi:hypothetical protein